MKKIILFISLIVLLAFLYSYKNNQYLIVPDESIRFRIIPNSNSVEDIFIKEKLHQSIEENLVSLSSSSIEETREKIESKIPQIEQNIRNVFNTYKYDKNFKVNYGLNYFPEKEYNGVLYKEGNYESLVISVGKAEGDNFWCVLFPPLCLIEASDSEEIEYKFFIKEIIDKFTHK